MDENQSSTADEKQTTATDEKQSVAANIRERFKNRTATPLLEKNSAEESKVESILEKAKEFEKIYTDEGQSRATQQKKAKVKQENAETESRQTTLRILLKDLIRFKKLEPRYLSEGEVLTYEKVFLTGLETIEGMSDSVLHGFIEKNRKKK